MNGTSYVNCVAGNLYILILLLDQTSIVYVVGVFRLSLLPIATPPYGAFPYIV